MDELKVEEMFRTCAVLCWFKRMKKKKKTKKKKSEGDEDEKEDDEDDEDGRLVYAKNN